MWRPRASRTGCMRAGAAAIPMAAALLRRQWQPNNELGALVAPLAAHLHRAALKRNEVFDQRKTEPQASPKLVSIGLGHWSLREQFKNVRQRLLVDADAGVLHPDYSFGFLHRAFQID